jgi:hypothetical protein
MPFVVFATSNGLSIASKATPRRAIAATTLLIGVVCLGFASLAYSKSEWNGAFGWVVAIGLLTSVFTPLMIVLHFQEQQRRGPVLTFDMNESTFELHRSAVRFKAADVECFCVLTGCVGSDWVWQLQLHTRQGGRFLLVPSYTRAELDPILRTFLARVPIPVRYYIEDRKHAGGWREEPFEEAS